MNIYLYGEINEINIINTLNEIDSNIDKNIDLHINSIGGGAYDAIAFYNNVNYKKKLGLKINTYIDGCCYSAATIILLVGDKKYAYRNTSYMIHYPSASIYNSFKPIENKTQEMKKLSNYMIKLYKNNSNLQLQDIKELMIQEKYLTSKELLNYNLIDKII